MKTIDSIEIIEVLDTKDNNDILDSEIKSLGYRGGIKYRDILSLPYVILLHNKSYYRTMGLMLEKLSQLGLEYSIPEQTKYNFLGVEVKASYYEIDVDNVIKIELPLYYKRTIEDLIKRQYGKYINHTGLVHNPRFNPIYEVLNHIPDEAVGSFLIYDLDLSTLEFILKVLRIDKKTDYYKSIIKKSKLVHNK